MVPLCRTRRSGSIRTYRVDRVREVVPLDDTFTPPADLDPVALLEEHLAVGWEHEVEVIVDAPIDEVAQRLPRALGRLERIDDASTRLVASTSNPRWYAEQLAAVPAAYRVVGSPVLRAAAREVAQRMLAATEG